MNTGTLFRVLFFTAIIWFGILGAGIFNELEVKQHSEEYVSAEFVVTGSYCFRSTGSSKSPGSKYCFLKGEVFIPSANEGVKEEVSIETDFVPSDYPSGKRIDVYYNPKLPAFGTNYYNRRVLLAEWGNPSESSQQWLDTVKQIFLLSLGMVVLVYVLLRWGVWSIQNRNRRDFVIDTGTIVPPSWGLLIFSLLLTILVWEFREPTAGTLIFGLIVICVGMVLLSRRFVHYSLNTQIETQGWHFFGVTLPVGKMTKKAAYKKAGIYSEQKGLIFRISSDESELIIPCEDDETIALSIAEKVEQRLKIPVTRSLENWQKSQRKKNTARQKYQKRILRRVVFFILIPVMLISLGWFAIEHVSQVRVSLIKKVLTPDDRFLHLRHQTILRQWVLSRVPNRPEEAELLELLRLANAIDPGRFPEIAMDLYETLLRCTTGVVPGKVEQHSPLLQINHQAATLLGRQLDANNGIFTWLNVDPKYQDKIDAIASTDPYHAWSAWNHFASNAHSAESFLYLFGPALGDTRPVSFAIKRGSFYGNDSRSLYEGQPEHLHLHSDVIVNTVGEALALEYWYWLEIKDKQFPDDFSKWWQIWAKEHHLPPINKNDKRND